MATLYLFSKLSFFVRLDVPQISYLVMEEQSEKGAESNQNVVITSANAKKFVVKRLLNPIFFKVRFNVNNRSYLLD